jgi:predicted deacylase
MLPLTESQKHSRRRLETFNPQELKRGEKGILDFQIAQAPDGTACGLSLMFVRGIGEGPVFLVNGATHGDEYEGPVTVQELFAELAPAEIRGTWLGVPVLNEPAMSVARRAGKYDDQDLARTFPGKPDGTVTEQIAFRFGQDLLKHCNYYVDLHSAGSIFRMIFLSGYGMNSDPGILEQQRRMGIAFGGDLVWGTPLFPGRTLSQAAEFGIPAIYAETTGGGGLLRQDVEQYKEGVKNVMRSVGMLEGDYPQRPRRFFRETSSLADKEGFLQLDHPAPCKGLFLPSVDLWDKVIEGQELGRIVDAAGRILARVYARRGGHVILVRHSLSVNEQEGLVVIVEGLQESASDDFRKSTP